MVTAIIFLLATIAAPLFGDMVLKAKQSERYSMMNAIEAVPQQTGHVTIHTELESDPNMLMLRVSDNGKGIEDVRTIFEPFHSEKPHVGTGLGLSIAKKIVQLHQGTIDVQSLPGEGSIFTVRIPIVES